MSIVFSAGIAWRRGIPCFALILSIVQVQSASSQYIKLSIPQTLQLVEGNLPQLKSLRQQAAAEQNGIDLAKNTMVPDMNVGYQVNTATYNNITGMNYPGFMLPISGPPSADNTMDFVPGTGAGALIKWNPVTFGQRKAAIQKATAQYMQASAAYNEQLFQFQYAAVNAYLEALYIKQVAGISQAVIDRHRVGLEQSLILARNGLKPGIDTAQFQSLVLQGEIDLVQAQRSYHEKLVELTRLSGLVSSSDSVILTDSVIKVFSVHSDSTLITTHPRYQYINAQQQTTAAALKEIQQSWVPKLDIWGNVYARGSGINASGIVHKADGFNLTRTNAGVGVQLSFPVFEFSKINIKKKQYGLLLKADQAKLEQAKLDIIKQIENAEFQYRQDIIIASKTPVQLKIAADVYHGLQISYEAGLIDYTRLYQAHYELMKAELNNAGAMLQLWRSLLAVAVAKGNLQMFSEQFN